MTSIRDWFVGIALAAAIAVAAAALLAVGAQHLKLVRLRTELAEAKQGRAEDGRLYLAAYAARNEAYRVRERITDEKQRKALDEERDKTSVARADADAVRAARDRLRNRIAATATGCPAGAERTEAPGGGPPAGAPADLQGDVLEGFGDAAGQLAAYADAARIAGETCERAYDALIPEVPGEGSPE